MRPAICAAASVNAHGGRFVDSPEPDGMNRAQRAILKFVLGIDAALLLYPPTEAQYGRQVRDLGHDWLSSVLFGDFGARINAGRLAAEVAIVSMIGFTICVVAHCASDDRALSIRRRLASARLYIGRTGAAMLGDRFAAVSEISAPAALVIGLVLGFALWAAIVFNPW